MGLTVDGRRHSGIGQCDIHHAAGSLHQFPGIQPAAWDAKRRKLGGKDLRREELTITLDGIEARGTEFTQQENPVKDAPKGIEQAVNGLPDSRQPVGWQQAFHHVGMPLVKGIEFRQIAFLPGGGQPPEPDQRVGTAADG